MFKVLVLQRYYNLSDEQTEDQISDRLSFQMFSGLTLSDSVPDQKTIWLFRETLSHNGREGEETDGTLHADSAYTGETIEDLLEENGVTGEIYEKRYRGGSGNSDSVISESLASPTPPGGGEPKERGNETHETESRSNL